MAVSPCLQFKPGRQKCCSCLFCLIQFVRALKDSLPPTCGGRLGVRCGSVVEQVPSMHKTFGLIFPVPKGKKEKTKQKTMEVMLALQ